MYNISVVFITQAAMAQSVARRLGKAEVGGSSPLGSLMKIACRQRVLNILWRHAVFCENRNFCLFIQKEKAGISSPAEKRGKSIYEKAFCFVCI